MAIMIEKGAPSQSLGARQNAARAHGLMGMLKNPYVFLTFPVENDERLLTHGRPQVTIKESCPQSWLWRTFRTNSQLSPSSTLQGWLVASLELGAWFGALFNEYLAEKISRKYKIAPPELGGSLVSLQQLSITIGTTIAFWLDFGFSFSFSFSGGNKCKPEGITNPYLANGTYNAAANYGHSCTGQNQISWRVPLALQLISAWTLLIGMFFFPFSPRWLMLKHREEEAIASLCKLRRLDANDPSLRAEFLEIKAAVMFDEETQAEQVGQGGMLTPWKALFVPYVFKRIFLGCGMMIFASFGFSSTTTTLLATGVTDILQVLFTLPAVLYLDKFGRKTFFIAGAIGMYICHIVVASIEGVHEDQWNLNEGLVVTQGWVAIVFISLFAVNFAYSWGPVTWVLAQEIFPASVRSRGVALVASTNWMFNFIIGLTTKDILGSMKYGTYIFFAVFSAGGGFFIWKFFPVTKDKTLEELDVYFGGSIDSIAASDKARMQIINERFGLTISESLEDIKISNEEKVATITHQEL
ncbi:sugar transporter [Sclerotinia borealis F-4128]|uniref:Sugar transporter n=1 Tax=Sclerotinia borealis (strain F-4128) TaxID=1432307 RepID=W9CBD0_SCLBF|nr:sugar transporter [Sclerotinia borealis F-4128]